jgi:hypothetical protein
MRALCRRESSILSEKRENAGEASFARRRRRHKLVSYRRGQQTGREVCAGERQEKEFENRAPCEGRQAGLGCWESDASSERVKSL